jgi:hypothetical protein
VRRIPVPAIKLHQINGCRITQLSRPLLHAANGKLTAAAVVIGEKDLCLFRQKLLDDFAVAEADRISDQKDIRLCCTALITDGGFSAF